MNLGSRCHFANQCTLFKGEEKTKIELSIFRNVFCNRGPKGWKNCERYKEFLKNQATDDQST